MDTPSSSSPSARRQFASLPPSWQRQGLPALLHTIQLVTASILLQPICVLGYGTASAPVPAMLIALMPTGPRSLLRASTWHVQLVPGADPRHIGPALHLRRRDHGTNDSRGFPSCGQGHPANQRPRDLVALPPRPDRGTGPRPGSHGWVGHVRSRRFGSSRTTAPTTEAPFENCWCRSTTSCTRFTGTKRRRSSNIEVGKTAGLPNQPIKALPCANSVNPAGLLPNLRRRTEAGAPTEEQITRLPRRTTPRSALGTKPNCAWRCADAD